MNSRNFLSTLVITLTLVFLSCTDKTPPDPIPVIIPPVTTVDTTRSKPGDGIYNIVNTRTNALSTKWTTYTAKTLDHLSGFTYLKDPALGTYGGYKVNQGTATGYFRVEKKGDRWWIIDPEGYPFINRGLAVFVAGTSTNQKAALITKYGSSQNWVNSESTLIRYDGFNGAGAWSDVDLIRSSIKPLAYTVIVSPMGAYNTQNLKNYGGTYPVIPGATQGWQGYRYDLAMVFDPQFDAYVESAISVISKYSTDKNLLGYFTDNEIPWVNDALDRHIKYLGTTEPGYIAAKAWLDARKGKNATAADITAADRLAFNGFYFETYVQKVAAAVRKYDPNHMYLGCKFNQWSEELSSSEIFRVAGKYMDIISIDHYTKWQPDMTAMTNWTTWSGKPFLIAEFYTKGEDSGLPNNTGAGWNVPAQLDRGYFYQNFAINLIQSKCCVGWHWFTYQDNDPLNLNTDPSNRDSNKGIVSSDFTPYKPLVDNMKKLNDHVYELTQFFDK